MGWDIKIYSACTSCSEYVHVLKVMYMYMQTYMYRYVCCSVDLHVHTVQYTFISTCMHVHVADMYMHMQCVQQLSRNLYVMDQWT